VAQTRSPKIQSAAIAAAGLSVRYEALRVPAAELQKVASRLLEERAGGNVTVPHKIAFRNLCGETTATAARTGAVNTFWTHDGKLVGDNTDVGGFDTAARAALGGRSGGVKVALIGAGGSAAAVLTAIEAWPRAQVNVFSRNPERAKSLAARFGDFTRAVSTIAEALAGSNFVVNATPVGMTDDSLPLAIEELTPGAVIMDLVYKSGGTALTRAAEAAGFEAFDGTEMLIEQGALAFERWFGIEPDRAVMRAALR